MSSWNGFNIFERSTREQVVYNPDHVTSVRPIRSSSTRQPSSQNPRTRSRRAVLDPPVDASRTESTDDPATPLLGCPYPVYSAVGIPEPANGQSLDSEEAEEQTMDESRAPGCRGCFDRYENAVKNFRNSKSIHILQFLFCHIPISAIIMGFLFVHDCPQTWYLPGFVTAEGIVGATFIGIWTTLSCRQYRGSPCSTLQKFALSMLGFLLIGTMYEAYLVVGLSPSYDSSTQDHCNKFFYYFLIYKEMATAVALLLAAFIYIPGTGLYTCCRECPMPLPASAFFNFR